MAKRRVSKDMAVATLLEYARAHFNIEAVLAAVARGKGEPLPKAIDGTKVFPLVGKLNASVIHSGGTIRRVTKGTPTGKGSYRATFRGNATNASEMVDLVALTLALSAEGAFGDSSTRTSDDIVEI